MQPDKTTTDLPDTLRLFSVQQVAKILQITETAVRRLIFEGKLEACRVGVLIRVPQDALERFLEASACTGPDERRDPRRGRP